MGNSEDSTSSREGDFHVSTSSPGHRATGIASEEGIHSTAIWNEKHSMIIEACRERDISSLVRLACTEGGLLDDGLRQDAWPLLLGCDLSDLDIQDDTSWKELPQHRDEEQVELDVNRAFVYYPNGQSDKDMDARKKALSYLIRRTLRAHPMLCYFQGYHDIVQVMLLVLGESRAVRLIERLSLLRIRDYMLPSLAPAERHLNILPALLDAADRQLCRHLAHTKPYFALGSTLTLYAHDVQDYSDIVRLYDFLLAQEPVIAIYLFAALIISRKDELLEIPQEEPDMLHWKLSKLPQHLDLETLIQKCIELFRLFPPETLPYGAWRQISAYSVLKTSRDLAHGQSLERGEWLFQKHEKQLRRDEMQKRLATQLWRYRRPAMKIFIGVLVLTMSIGLRRTGHDRTIVHLLSNMKEWIISKT